jgi:hypothetical protein
VPFKKTGKDKYTSPSGKKFTKKQVKMYYATEGFTKKPNTRKADKIRGKKRSR